MDSILFTPAPPRMWRKRKTTNSPPPTPPPGDLVVTDVRSINYDEENHVLWVSPGFNSTEANPVVGAESADPGKWSLRFNGKRYTAVAVYPGSFDEIALEMTAAQDESGTSELVYLNNPSDLADSQGHQLAAFTLVF